MTARRSYTRHGLTAPMVKVKLAGFGAIDRRTAAARATLAFKNELIAALGGEAGLSPQRRKLIDLAARASLLLPHRRVAFPAAQPCQRSSEDPLTSPRPATDAR